MVVCGSVNPLMQDIIKNPLIHLYIQWKHFAHLRITKLQNMTYLFTGCKTPFIHTYI